MSAGAKRRIALVGGSNCLIKDGFGHGILDKLSDHDVSQFSLGASSIVRAMSVLTDPKFDLASWDHVIIEYTINDLIFEQVGAFNPIFHRLYLSDLTRLHRRYGNIFVCVMPNRPSYGKVGMGRSAIYKNYVEMLASVPDIGVNLMPLIENQPGETDDHYFDNDHFTPAVADILAAQVCETVLKADPATRKIAENINVPTYQSLSKFRDVSGEPVTTEHYKTGVAEATLYLLGADQKLQVTSPGGAFLGSFVRTSDVQGTVRFQWPGGLFLKNFQDSLTLSRKKPYYCLRHFTAPRRIPPGETLNLSLETDTPDRPLAYDVTHGEIRTATPAENQQIAFGPLVFRLGGPGRMTF